MAYITGILPIKKIEDESALNNFDEYTMITSEPITQYFGFTQEEVKELCEKYDMDFETAKAWYNGYLIDGIHMYNPDSVSMAMNKRRFDSYWKNTSSFTSINTLSSPPRQMEAVRSIRLQRRSQNLLLCIWHESVGSGLQVKMDRRLENGKNSGNRNTEFCRYYRRKLFLY